MKKWYVLPLGLLAFSAVMAVQSAGFFEHDEIPHFLKAREMLHDWKQVLDIWGRPLCTGLYSLGAAAGGLIGARLLAVLVTAWTGCGVVRLLQALDTEPSERHGFFGQHGAVWVWLLLYAQPLFLLNSFTVMTEMLLACLWVWAAVLLVRGRVGWAGLVLGLGGLARPEGWVAIALWPVFLWVWRRVAPPDPSRNGQSMRLVASVILSLLPVTVWWVVAAIAYHNLRWMIDYFPWEVHSQYGRSGLMFVLSSLIALAVWMWGVVLAGVLSLWRRRDRRGLLILVVPSGAFFLLHAVLGTFGLMGSMSLPRYFICVSPFLAVLGVLGLQALERHTRRQRLLRKGVMIAVVMPALLLVMSGSLPVPLSTNARQQDVAIRAFRERIPRSDWNARLLASDPYVYYRLDLPMDTPFHERVFHPDSLRIAPAGTFLITDSLLWNREGRPSPDDLAQWGYRYDPLVDRDIAQVKATFDLEAIGAASWPPHMGVALWIKDR